MTQPTKSKSGGISFTRGDSVPDEKPSPLNGTRAKENVKAGRHPHAPAEPLVTGADAVKKR